MYGISNQNTETNSQEVKEKEFPFIKQCFNPHIHYVFIVLAILRYWKMYTPPPLVKVNEEIGIDIFIFILSVLGIHLRLFMLYFIGLFIDLIIHQLLKYMKFNYSFYGYFAIFLALYGYVFGFIV
jgi:hypothetical protein